MNQENDLDRAISVAWYDLPESGREEYLAWMHESYIPRLLRYPGILWAAHYRNEDNITPLPQLRHTTDNTIPGGYRYIFMLGARDAHAFSSLTSFHQFGKPDAIDRKMLALRAGERLNIFTEEARVDGPRANQRQGEYTLAPCIQLGTFNAGSYKDEDELLSWYAEYRLPAMRMIPSSLGMRKLVSVSGWAKHGVLYEFTSLEARAKTFRAHEAQDPATAAWSNEVITKLVHAPGSPNVAQRIWPPLKAIVPAT
jgi:hypothetical protein